jgi:glutamate N-acetyltransferase/amino-acid N-acetyltransferase
MSARQRDRLKIPFKNCRGGICAPQGFLAAAERAGLKKAGLDLAIIFSDAPASAAACFTLNQCAAAPVQLCRRHLKEGSGKARAILINSGCANAGTGLQGVRDARSTVNAVAQTLNIPLTSVLVCSTGVIGLRLQAQRIIAALPACARRLSRKEGARAARAILTTDTVLKVESLAFKMGGRAVRIGGIAKGAGMIHPDLATMLAFITTDASIAPARLQEHLNWCVERSFNCITVDGDTSTNDTVIALANGASGIDVGKDTGMGRHGDTGTLTASPRRRVTASSATNLQKDLSLYFSASPRRRVTASAYPELFRAALLEICQRLARKIAWDGEGSTHHLEIEVTGAKSFRQARNVGRSIGRSNLVKTAIYGHDPNWGRVLSAVGASGERIVQSRIRLSVNQRVVAEQGVLKNIADSVFDPIWRKKRIHIAVDLGLGEHRAVCWSCDLSHEYVDINASYRT